MNAAQRILTIYDKLVSYGNFEHPLNTVWAHVFGLDGNPEDEVMQCQHALRSQIDSVRASLNALELPKELQEPGFPRLREAASPAHHHQAWKSQRGNVVSTECRQNLVLAVWLLRSEVEDEMDAETFESLKRELADLEEAALAPEISSYLRSFIQRQVDTIRAALRVYQVAGVKPIKDALRTVTGDIVFERTNLETEINNASDETKGVLAKTAEVIKKTSEVCEQLDKIKKFGESAYAIGKAVAPYVALAIPYFTPT